MTRDADFKRRSKEKNGSITRGSNHKLNGTSKSQSLKITTVGDGMVGKTCMLFTYSKHQFPHDYIPTVFDNFSDKLEVDGQEYDIVLWDTAGQEDYERLRPLSYPGTNCFILCFSIGARSSFENVLSKWYPEIKNKCPNVPIILVGTKTDLRESGTDTISVKEAKKMRRKLGVHSYLECSALKNEGLEEIFVEAVRAAVNPPKKERCCQCRIL
ncbi:ras-like GTP-binding protein RhoL [Bemisia tabaci]|uniref:ras-like GTP-binding protein RhoL n=1 Tax=Bemisia tabaci TaxID=7038 RepID=UPI00194771BA